MKVTLINIILLLVAGYLLIKYIFKSTENFAGGFGARIQLAAGNSQGGHYSIRPVRQRGMYFNNPSWTR